MIDKMKETGLYIHIPFCASKCSYCDFYSITGTKEEKEKYVSALIRQLKFWGDRYPERIFDTIYIGGGTPSVLDAELIERLLYSIKENFRTEHNAEITMEANPDSASKRVLKAAFLGGVNRLSFGAQSFLDDELQILGRRHKACDIDKAFYLAKECGFTNISLDIIFALPNQTQDKLDYTLSKLSELSPLHISAYGLKLEQGTPLYNKQSILKLPDEDSEYRLYTEICSFLKDRGYEHYEISNFARNGFRSRHNMRYWQGKEYLGLGPAAHSFLDGERFSYNKDIKSYISKSEKGIVKPDATEIIGRSGMLAEYIMLSLRTSEGLTFNRLSEFIDEKKLFKIRTFADKLKTNDYVSYNSDGFSLTEKGFWVSNAIIGRLLDLI